VARRPGEPFGACDLWRSNAEAPGTEHSSAAQRRAVEPPDSPYTTALTISDHAGQRLHTIEADGAQLVAHRFAPAGHQLAVVAWDSLGAVRLIIWDTDSGKRLATHELAVPGEVYRLALFWN